MSGLLRGCFGIVSDKRNDAEIGGRLGVSFPPGNIIPLLPFHP